MQFEDRDFKESEELAHIVNEIDYLDIQKTEAISDKIAKRQPFLISLLLGYRFDMNEVQLEGMMKLLFIIYIFYEQKTDISKYQITETDFEFAQKRNIQFLEYFQKETLDMQTYLTKIDLSNIRFKGLFSVAIHSILENGYFDNMDFENKGIIIIGIKSLIECLEAKLLYND